MKVIRIISKKEGFRRAGIAHSETPIDHPLDRFTKQQLEQLKTEPMLVLQEVEIEDADEGKKTKKSSKES